MHTKKTLTTNVSIVVVVSKAHKKHTKSSTLERILKSDFRQQKFSLCVDGRSTKGSFKKYQE